MKVISLTIATVLSTAPGDGSSSRSKSSESDRSRSPLERQLGLTFLEPFQIARRFDETEGAYISNRGLINFNLRGESSAFVGELRAKNWLGPNIASEEFKRACVTMCDRNRSCKAAAFRDFGDNELLQPEVFSLGRDYYCKLLGTDAKVRGIPTAQMYSAPPEVCPSDIVWVKKGHTVQPLETCQINFSTIEASLTCLNCYPYTIPGLNLANIVDCRICPALIGLPGSSPQPDFWAEVVPAARCLGNRTAGCLACIFENTQGGRNTEVVNAAICTENDSYNIVRGGCQMECYDGIEGCESLLQTASLCVLGARDAALPCDAVGVEGCNFTIHGGVINTPYECPQME